MKRNLIRAGLGLMALAFTAINTFAQGTGAAETNNSGISKGLGYIAAGVGFAIAAGLCGLGQGKIAAAACDGMARNPSAYNRIQLALILGLAFVETLVIFTFVVVLIKLPNP